MHKIPCKYCDTTLRVRKFTSGFEYICPNCSGLVYRSGASSASIVIMSLSTLVIFFWMITSDVLTVTLLNTKSRSILDSIEILYQNNYPVSSAILFMTVVLIPILMIFLINIIIFGNKLKIPHFILKKAISIYEELKDWNMAEVYMVGILISMIKLEELTTMHINFGFWIILVYVIMFYLTLMWFNPHDILETVKITKKDKNSIFKSTLYLVLALIFIIPSNVLPIMPTYKFGVEYNNTIWGGIVALWEDKDYFIASVIFFTSICIPLLKILSVFVMILMAKYNILEKYKKIMTIYYRVNDGWGKYSMLDVFVVVIAASFVQFDQLVRIESGTAIMPFTLVVFFTMMASKSFDVRLIWEKK
ncbi:MAG: paraquat-inducible protein A [Arcobacteraceae bacterium]